MTSLVSGRCGASIYGLPPVQPLALSSVLLLEFEDCGSSDSGSNGRTFGRIDTSLLLDRKVGNAEFRASRPFPTHSLSLTSYRCGQRGHKIGPKSSCVSEALSTITIRIFCHGRVLRPKPSFVVHLIGGISIGCTPKVRYLFFLTVLHKSMLISNSYDESNLLLSSICLLFSANEFLRLLVALKIQQHLICRYSVIVWFQAIDAFSFSKNSMVQLYYNDIIIL
jgi:hypothetical protein